MLFKIKILTYVSYLYIHSKINSIDYLTAIDDFEYEVRYMIQVEGKEGCILAYWIVRNVSFFELQANKTYKVMNELPTLMEALNEQTAKFEEAFLDS